MAGKGRAAGCAVGSNWKGSGAPPLSVEGFGLDPPGRREPLKILFNIDVVSMIMTKIAKLNAQ